MCISFWMATVSTHCLAFLKQVGWDSNCAHPTPQLSPVSRGHVISLQAIPPGSTQQPPSNSFRHLSLPLLPMLPPGKRQVQQHVRELIACYPSPSPHLPPPLSLHPPLCSSLFLVSLFLSALLCPSHLSTPLLPLLWVPAPLPSHNNVLILGLGYLSGIPWWRPPPAVHIFLLQCIS